jgi:molecular chaperone DnaJ
MRQSILGSFVNVTVCPTCEGSGEIIASPCHTCQGQKQVQQARSLSVKIPAGVDNETQIRLSGEGAPGGDGGPPGNLYVVLNIRKHEHFQRRGDDILLDLEINVAQAALGDEVVIPLVDGEEKIAIPPGTQSGKVFRLRGRGVPHLRRSGRGDQLVIVQVAIPKTLTADQERLFKELARTLGKEIIPQRERGILSQLKDALGDVLGI